MIAPTLRQVPLELVYESTLNYRQRLDAELDADFLGSLRTQGQLTPGLVRPHFGPDGAIARYEPAAGARRRRGLEAIGATTMLCLVREMDDRTFLEAMVTENLQRSDPHPVDESAAYTQLEKLGYDVGEIALRVGKSASYVHQRLKLRDLIGPAQADFLGGKMLLGHALLLARRTAAQQESLLKRLYGYDGRPIPVWNLQRLIHETCHVSLSRAPFKIDDAALLPAAGACTTCPKHAGAYPDLFTEVEGRNVCTDRACYEMKLAAHINQRVAAATATGKALTPVSGRGWNPTAPVRPGKALNQAQWHEATKGDAGAVPVIHVDGERAGRTAYAVLARPEPRTKQTTPVRESSRESYDQRRARLEALAARELPFRAQVVEAALAAIESQPITPRLLEMALRAVWDIPFAELPTDQTAQWLRLPEVPTWDGRAAAYAPLAGEARFWAALMVAGELDTYNVEDPPMAITALAEYVGISMSAMREAYDAEHPVATTPEVKKVAKKATKKSKAKAKATKRRAGDVRREKKAAAKGATT